jgi:hypothetical protein
VLGATGQGARALVLAGKLSLRGGMVSTPGVLSVAIAGARTSIADRRLTPGFSLAPPYLRPRRNLTRIPQAAPAFAADRLGKSRAPSSS